MSQSGCVFHLFHSTGIGGAEIHLLQLATAQREQGWRPVILARSDGWLAKQATTERLEVLPLRMRGFFDPASTIRLGGLVRRHRPDLLHAHAMRGSHYARLVRRWCRTPKLVMTAHSTNAWKHFDRKAPVVCVSRAVEAAMRARGLSNLQLIYNGIPEHAPPPPESLLRSSLYRQLTRQQGTRGRLVLLQVGRFIPDKGQDWLLQQLEKLPQELAARTLTLFAGDWQGTDYGRGCHRRFLASRRLRDRAIFLGQQGMAALTAWYQLADVLVLPSRREACPLCLLEAARAGVPALASRVGGVPELLRDAETGYLYPREDGPAFGARLRLLLDPAHRLALGAAARAHFLERFTADRMTSQTLALYHRILQGEG